MNAEQVALGILTRGDRILLVDIPIDAREFHGMVGFPGGNIEDGETLQEGCGRLIMEKTHVLGRVEQKLGVVHQHLDRAEDPDRHVDLHVFDVEYLEHDELSNIAFWNDIDELDSLEIVPSNLRIFQELYRFGRHDEYRSVVEKNTDGEYVQTEFEPVY